MMDPALIWFLIAVGLFLLEFAAPGVVLVFFSMGAAIVSLLTWLGILDTFNTQMLVFTIVSVLCLVFLRTMMKRWFVGDDKFEMTQDEYIGHQVTVVKLIPGGAKPGLIEHKGANWNAIATKAIEEGTVTEIVSIDGLTVTVKEI